MKQMEKIFFILIAMTVILKRFLPAGTTFIPKIHSRQLRFTYSACVPYSKTKKECKNLIKQELQEIFIKINQAKPSLSMIWVTEILKIYQEEQLLKKYNIINHLILLKIQNVMNIKVVLLPQFTNFLLQCLQIKLQHSSLQHLEKN